MPSVYQLKPAFQDLLRPAVDRLARIGVTANMVTVAACLLSVLLGLILAFGTRQWWILPIWLLLRMAMNAMDGMLATEYGQKTRLGAMLNELTDVISDAALTLPFAFLPGWNGAWVGLFVLLAALTEMTGVMTQAMGAGRRYDGPFGKADRALALGFLGVWLTLGWPLPGWIPMAMSALCAITIYNRGRHAV